MSRRYKIKFVPFIQRCHVFKRVRWDSLWIKLNDVLIHTISQLTRFQCTLWFLYTAPCFCTRRVSQILLWIKTNKNKLCAPNQAKNVLCFDSERQWVNARIFILLFLDQARQQLMLWIKTNKINYAGQIKIKMCFILIQSVSQLRRAFVHCLFSNQAR